MPRSVTTEYQNRELDKLNSQVRYAHCHGNANGEVCCYVIDKDTDKVYAKAYGHDEPTAVAKAIEVAKTSAKPMTASAAADFSKIVSEKDKKIKELEELLASKKPAKKNDE